MINTTLDVEDGVSSGASVTVRYLSRGVAEVLVTVDEKGDLSVNVSTWKGNHTSISVDDIDILD